LRNGLLKVRRKPLCQLLTARVKEGNTELFDCGVSEIICVALAKDEPKKMMERSSLTEASLP